MILGQEQMLSLGFTFEERGDKAPMERAANDSWRFKSRDAVVILASPNTLDHSPNARF